MVLPKKHIAIVTFHEDFHARLIKAYLNQNRSANCSLIFTDRIGGTNAISWSQDVNEEEATVRDAEGRPVPLNTLDLIWWRRIKKRQRSSNAHTDEGKRAFIDSSCWSSLSGLLMTSFKGRWISDPIYTERAENKLLQLQVAKAAGFNVPKTLVSQDPRTIKRFYASCSEGVIAKPLVTTSQAAIFTKLLEKRHLRLTNEIQTCPTIFQEFIPGCIHLRVNRFGKDTHAFRIKTAEMDWRQDMNKACIEPVELDSRMKRQIGAVCRELRLAMGVFDFKLTPKGTPVWLEVNPQGQFLFLEGMTGVPLGSHFAEFLWQQA
jgi:hypothetical protein